MCEQVSDGIINYEVERGKNNAQCWANASWMLNSKCHIQTVNKT